MKLLIDDERNILPDGTVPDLIIRNYETATYFFTVWNGNIAVIDLYLDHDLGGEKTGYDIVCEIEQYFGLLPAKIVCVSDNAPGRMRINQVIEKLYGRLFYE